MENITRLVCLSYNRETEGERTFQANGAKLWNSIPLDIRKKDFIGSFKTSLKKDIFSQEPLGQFLDVHVIILKF